MKVTRADLHVTQRALEDSLDLLRHIYTDGCGLTVEEAAEIEDLFQRLGYEL